MAIPTQTAMFQLVLSAMDDGGTRTIKEILDLVRRQLNLSADDVLEETSSGVPVYESRIRWAITYLNRAAYFIRVSRGTYKITDVGKEMLSKGLSEKSFLHEMNVTIARDNPWNIGSGKSGEDREISEHKLKDDNTRSPQELIDDQVNLLNESLASDLLSRILENSSDFFEQLVVDLVERMGYGRGKKTRRSGDHGIDGMITTDELGFSPVYTQAKRYAPENHVGSPEVQAFAGAMNWVTNGIFITTSTFTDGAKEFANGYKHGQIKLVDGKMLVDLMIKHKLGVTVDKTIEIMKIDLDYFEG